ncbi:MAG: hypothetical protein P9X22_09210 [Candidatus Zapsychrus exili]|nr:hypothetical protein [Candidatus Zapsychrus exili]
MMDPPDVALVNLSLVDLLGDLVVQRLARMSKTSDVKYILYAQTGEHQQSIIDHFAEKTGVVKCMEYAHPDELLAATDNLFNKKLISCVISNNI